jgi:uncharacterized protein YhfF
VTDEDGVSTGAEESDGGGVRPDDFAVDEFWRQFRDAGTDDGDDSLPQTPDYVFSFTDDPAVADELGHLVVDGEKQATADALWRVEETDEKVPEPGDLSVVVDGSGDPLCVIETTGVEVVPYDEVGIEFARAEGEGFESVADWRETHWRYFSRVLDPLGRTPTETMPVVCERFRVVYAPPTP